MYAIMCEIMTQGSSLFSNPIGYKYMVQKVFPSREEARQAAAASASQQTNRKYTVVDLEGVSSYYNPPQEKKYAAVFD